MPSFTLPWTEIKEYQCSIGPDIGRPARPAACPFCDAEWIWFNGWRVVHCVLLSDGQALRIEDGVALQRVVCPSCGVSWTLRPAFLYPHRSFEPDINEAAALAYLSEAEATYVAVAARFQCSWKSVWLWVGWLARLVSPSELIAEIARLDAKTPAADLIPRAVAQDHTKAYSSERDAVLLRAYQTLVALSGWARGQAVPFADPSPLRCFLTARFRTFRRYAFLTRDFLSPPFHMDLRGPPDS